MTLKETQKERISRLEADNQFLSKMAQDCLDRTEQLLDLVNKQAVTIQIYEDNMKAANGEIQRALNQVNVYRVLETEVMAEQYE